MAGDSLASPATSASSVFLVLAMIVAATILILAISTAFAFLTFAAILAFRAVRVTFALAAGTVFATTFCFHFFLFFLVLLRKQGHTAG